MTKEQNDRLVVAWELIAKSLEGLHEEVRKAGKRYWPEPGQQRESVLTRVETEEDRAKKNLGLADESISINEWLDIGDPESESYIGERTAQWLRDHPKESKEVKVVDAGAEESGKQDSPSPKKTKSKA
jgi:hypothetical protein